MYASLASPERDEELHLLKDGKTRCTTGSVVSSLYHLKDPEADSTYFTFFSVLRFFPPRFLCSVPYEFLFHSVRFRRGSRKILSTFVAIYPRLAAGIDILSCGRWSYYVDI